LLRLRKFGRRLYLLAGGVCGALLIELLIQNGFDHLSEIRAGTGDQGLFAYLNDRLYIPAAAVAISTIYLFIEARVPSKSNLCGLLVVAGLLVWFGRLL